MNDSVAPEYELTKPIYLRAVCSHVNAELILQVCKMLNSTVASKEVCHLHFRDTSLCLLKTPILK